VLELAPVHWRQTLERPEVLQRLDANGYRRASLAPQPPLWLLPTLLDERIRR
jgi:hypothetical protein